MATTAPVIPPSVSPIPTPPSTTDPQNFDVRADAFLGSLPTNQSEMNALGSNVYDNALKTYNSAVDANTAANVAVPAADSANNSAVAAANAYTNMQKLYLGAKSTPPAQDNQGNALSVGAWYTNTTSGYWYWWNGSSWLLGMSDLGSVSWLTQVTDKPTTLPGYGITDKTLARTDLGLKSAAIADILGPVSQSGGVPTGAIIQRGSNANGEFVRFADGTQICSFRMPIAQFTTIAPPNGTAIGAWTFPASFVSSPLAFFKLEGTYSSAVNVSPDSSSTTGTATIWATCFAASIFVYGPMACMAIGRWF